MARGDRQEPVGIPIHVIGRGCGGQAVFGTDEDRGHFVYLLNGVVEDFAWQVLDWVLMSNHHHVILKLAEKNLSVGMKRLHGFHAVAWNERHSQMGHVWQGRFVSKVIDRPGYAERVARYIDLNPVRAQLVRNPADWEWGGYRANAGIAKGLPFHDVPAGRRLVVGGEDLTQAEICTRYRRSTEAGVEHERGGPAVEGERPGLIEVLSDSGDDRIHEATSLWGYSIGEVALAYGVHPRTVMRWRDEGRTPALPLDVTKGSDPFVT
ncbi:MAG: transposase [Thermoleophilia bacterium]|nr:transposase [Thermoleophilia bacterium]